ncbi:dihydroxyacetone kinase subunit DhaL [Arthrobacter sp. AZCC_0090]|uniref:dihydroxyacetone kinase subunit DhaL n=1 Tax=Arthrobacter sp. AZCC_0090 TaxID=2735881 RepID=UPI00161A0971|nr:dihydroxyacetone kinase subunit DhaL [Arthrobacter sp. AZCC_0090]MBB6405235.1 dihydroxyacetone kinase-like protein [Arthrobacter sp. AZCC_0090]
MTNLIDGGTALAWFTAFSERFASTQAYLTELDRLAGDGDFGVNIASALERTQERLPPAMEATCTTVFEAASRGFMATGGTSGPLFGMWFRDIAKGTKNEAAAVTDIAQGIAAGLSSIQKLGGARVGDNTMIDALEPASVALTAGAERGSTLGEGLLEAALAARAGAESTGDLIAARGRASYVGELARGVLDPGAVTIALFFEAGADTVGAGRAWQPLGATA